VLIPRGSEKLIETVMRQATVPVIETGAGNCHLFIDETAEQTMANEIVLNAKLQRPSVCNAIETVLIDKTWFAEHGVRLLEQREQRDVELFDDKTLCALFPKAKRATEEHWYKDSLVLSMSAKHVDSCAEAIDHNTQYVTHHSEALVTENEA